MISKRLMCVGVLGNHRQTRRGLGCLFEGKDSLTEDGLLKDRLLKVIGFS